MLLNTIYYPIIAVITTLIAIVLFIRGLRQKKLLEEREKGQGQRIYQIWILKEIQDRIGYSLDVEKVTDVITGSLRALFSYSTTAALIRKDDKLVFKLIVEESVSHNFVQQVKNSMLASFTALSDQPLPQTIEDSITGTILNDGNGKPLASFFHIPLIVNNEVMALINVSSTKPGLYKEQEMTILYQITNEASQALTRLHEVLTTEKGKLMALIGGLVDGVFMIDTNNSLLVINEAAKSLLGIQKPSPTIFDIISSFSQDFDIAAKMQEAISGNKIIQQKELSLGAKTVQIFITPVVRLAGNPSIQAESQTDVIGASILIHDITLEKALSQMKEDFTNMMVHELRAPLTSIKDASSLLSGGDMGEDDKKKMLEIIHQQSQYMLTEVSSLLDAAKLESGRFTLQKTKTDLLKILRDQAQVFLPIARNKNITLVTNLPDSMPEIDVDQVRITQVINNLLSNSLKYTNQGGTVVLRGSLFTDSTKGGQSPQSAQSPQSGLGAPSPYAYQQLMISVSDNGIGIPKEKQSVLFSRFGQINQSAGPAGSGHTNLSSGLGLYITKGIVEAHNGTISLESEEGKGTTVSIYLPLTATATTESNILSATMKPSASFNQLPKNKIVN